MSPFDPHSVTRLIAESIALSDPASNGQVEWSKVAAQLAMSLAVVMHAQGRGDKIVELSERAFATIEMKPEIGELYMASASILAATKLKAEREAEAALRQAAEIERKETN